MNKKNQSVLFIVLILIKSNEITFAEKKLINIEIIQSSKQSERKKDVYICVSKRDY